jgi:hypothetical protein
MSGNLVLAIGIVKRTCGQDWTKESEEYSNLVAWQECVIATGRTVIVPLGLRKINCSFSLVADTAGFVTIYYEFSFPLSFANLLASFHTHLTSNC